MDISVRGLGGYGYFRLNKFFGDEEVFIYVNVLEIICICI